MVDRAIDSTVPPQNVLGAPAGTDCVLLPAIAATPHVGCMLVVGGLHARSGVIPAARVTAFAGLRLRTREISTLRPCNLPIAAEHATIGNNV